MNILKERQTQTSSVILKRSQDRMKVQVQIQRHEWERSQFPICHPSGQKQAQLRFLSRAVKNFFKCSSWRGEHLKMTWVTMCLQEDGLKCSILSCHPANFSEFQQNPSVRLPMTHRQSLFFHFLHDLDHCRSFKGFFLNQEEPIDFRSTKEMYWIFF